MEQQQISVAKAGIVATLPARCSIIAAANPKHGSYNMGKTVAENINIAAPLLSRFDLVFILRDRADMDQDTIISSNIMDLYRTNASHPKHKNPTMNADDDEKGWIRLEPRLRYVADTQRVPLPADLLVDYIAYARQYCKPRLTVEAANVLKDYFMQLRHGQTQKESVPITTRQLEALIRLSQARAKACLREFVLEEDALDVVDLMKESVHQVHVDEWGNVDRTRGGAGGRSNRKGKRAFLKALTEYGRKFGLETFTMNDFRQVADMHNLPLDGFQDMIDDLRTDAELLKTASGYKLNK